MLLYSQTAAKLVAALEAGLAGDTGAMQGAESAKAAAASASQDLGALCAASFSWGLLASLTPCVYPTAAATVSLFAAASAPDGGFGLPSVAAKGAASIGWRTRCRELRQVGTKAAAYALGVSLSYAALGVAVSLATVR